MKAALKKDLEALAEKHGMELEFQCLYCARKRETFGWPETGESFMLTLTEQKPKEAKS